MNEISEILKLHFTQKKLQAGDYFAKEGQYSKTIGYVEIGLLHSYQIDHKGEIVTTNFFQAESFCGAYYSFYRQQPALEFIKAITPAILHIIDYDTLQALFSVDLRLNQLGRLAIEEVCISKDIRLSKMLKLDAKARYLWFMEEYPDVIEKAPLKLIASYLGMKPESLSRIRKQLIS
ncbi:MAG TPA: hypothetical protein DCE41_30280 [Cytophagales bacterium]|nr:hypothetical protein [Cytophagales bacterium]